MLQNHEFQNKPLVNSLISDCQIRLTNEGDGINIKLQGNQSKAISYQTTVK